MICYISPTPRLQKIAVVACENRTIQRAIQKNDSQLELYENKKQIFRESLNEIGDDLMTSRCFSFDEVEIRRLFHRSFESKVRMEFA
jgi:hypothetical protein